MFHSSFTADSLAFPYGRRQTFCSSSKHTENSLQQQAQGVSFFHSSAGDLLRIRHWKCSTPPSPLTLWRFLMDVGRLSAPAPNTQRNSLQQQAQEVSFFNSSAGDLLRIRHSEGLLPALPLMKGEILLLPLAKHRDFSTRLRELQVGRVFTVNGCDSKRTTNGPKVTQLYFAQSK